MLSPIRARVRRAGVVPALVLGLVLAACSGGADATGPDEDPPQQGPGPQVPGPQIPGPQDPGPQNPGPQVPGPQNPGPTQPLVAGTYALGQINQSTPGQLVTIANPDGSVIGLYRFDASTTLVLHPLQTWTLEIRYSDDKDSYVIADEGEFSWVATEEKVELTFESAVYGDVFPGLALDGAAAVRYDMDGDGELDTTFGFQQITGGGD